MLGFIGRLCEETFPGRMVVWNRRGLTRSGPLPIDRRMARHGAQPATEGSLVFLVKLAEVARKRRKDDLRDVQGVGRLKAAATKPLDYHRDIECCKYVPRRRI